MLHSSIYRLGLAVRGRLTRLLMALVLLDATAVAGLAVGVAYLPAAVAPRARIRMLVPAEFDCLK